MDSAWLICPICKKLPEFKPVFEDKMYAHPCRGGVMVIVDIVLSSPGTKIVDVWNKWARKET